MGSSLPFVLNTMVLDRASDECISVGAVLAAHEQESPKACATTVCKLLETS